MTNGRFPADTAICKDDFDKDDCQRILEDASGEEYSTMYDAFSGAARKAIDEGKTKEGKIYWLLSDACSMMLNPESRNEPFKPFAVLTNRRSAILDDFTEEDIELFSEIINNVSSTKLKARLADIVWVKAQKKDVQNALTAIDSYRKIPLNTETWVRDGRECWYRAVSLAAMLKAGAGTRIHEMEQEIVQAFDSALDSGGYLALWLADLMSSFGMGKSKKKSIPKKLESLAKEFDEKCDLDRSRDYFKASSEWYDLLSDKKKSIEMTISLAESYVRDAISRTACDQPSYMVATGFYEKAIQIYRTIPRAYRAKHKVDERILMLHKAMNDAGGKTLDQMGEVYSGDVDLSKSVERSKEEVSNKPALDAIKAFANLAQVMRYTELRDSAIKQIRDFPLSSLFSGSHFSNDGRVIAKTPGVSFDEELTDEQPNVRSYMIKNHGIHLSLIVQGCILPALEVIQAEHRLKNIDFLAIVQQSPIVPPGRESLFAKGLFAGYDHDYVTALHILVPQIEHMVRFHLKNAGAKTSTLDLNGIENENGLSTLVVLPEMKAVFGEDLTFEIEALFCDSLGANLRNMLAHGLMDHNACNSFHSAYAWWFTLRLVFNTFWNAARSETEDNIEEEEK